MYRVSNFILPAYSLNKAGMLFLSGELSTMASFMCVTTHLLICILIIILTN